MLICSFVHLELDVFKPYHHLSVQFSRVSDTEIIFGFVQDNCKLLYIDQSYHLISSGYGICLAE